MGIAENRALISAHQERLNRGAIDATADDFAEDARNHGRPVGREGVRRVLHDIHQTLPEHRWDILDMVAEGDDVVVRCKVSGIHLGTGRLAVNGGLLVGVPPTGRRFEVQHIHWYKVRMGRSSIIAPTATTSV
jgi:predicted ester cyclase